MIQRLIEMSCDGCGDAYRRLADIDMSVLIKDASGFMRVFGDRHLCRFCAEAQGETWSVPVSWSVPDSVNDPYGDPYQERDWPVQSPGDEDRS